MTIKQERGQIGPAMRRAGVVAASCDAFGDGGFVPLKSEHHFSTPQRSFGGRIRLEDELENISTAERFSHTCSELRRRPFSNGEKGLLRNSAFTVITPRNERHLEGEEPAELERKTG